MPISLPIHRMHFDHQPLGIRVEGCFLFLVSSAELPAFHIISNGTSFGGVEKHLV